MEELYLLIFFGQEETPDEEYWQYSYGSEPRKTNNNPLIADYGAGDCLAYFFDVDWFEDATPEIISTADSSARQADNNPNLTKEGDWEKSFDEDCIDDMEWLVRIDEDDAVEPSGVQPTVAPFDDPWPHLEEWDADDDLWIGKVDDDDDPAEADNNPLITSSSEWDFDELPDEEWIPEEYPLSTQATTVAPAFEDAWAFDEEIENAPWWQDDRSPDVFASIPQTPPFDEPWWDEEIEDELPADFPSVTAILPVLPGIYEDAWDWFEWDADDDYWIPRIDDDDDASEAISLAFPTPDPDWDWYGDDTEDDWPHFEHSHANESNRFASVVDANYLVVAMPRTWLAFAPSRSNFVFALSRQWMDITQARTFSIFALSRNYTVH